MKRFFLLLFSMWGCSPMLAQFRERPATGALRASQKTTHVEGNLRKALDFAVSRRVCALSFSRNGDVLAVATSDSLALWRGTGARQTEIWDGSREPGALFEDRPPTRAVLAFSPDDRQLCFCGPRGLQMWAWATGSSFDQKPEHAWKAPDVYNAVFVDSSRVVCAAKKGSAQWVQLRNTSDGSIVWEKESGLLPVAVLQSQGPTIVCIVGAATGSGCYRSEWNAADGHQSLPTDMGTLNGLSASLSPDGRFAAGVRGELSIVTLETSEAKNAIAPLHSWPYRYGYYWPYYRDEWFFKHYRYPYDWRYDFRVDTGWTTLFSPDGNSIVTIGKEAVFYGKNTGVIEGRIYFSDNPFPLPGTTEAETDGIGCFSPDGRNFALVRQSRVVYSSTYNRVSEKHGLTRQIQGASAVEVYAVGAG